MIVADKPESWRSKLYHAAATFAHVIDRDDLDDKQRRDLCDLVRDFAASELPNAVLRERVEAILHHPI